MISDALSVTALVVSVVTFAMSYRASHRAERRSRIPVLVFVYDPARGWMLRNVGNGPALNIIVAQQHVTGERARSWYAPVRVPPLAAEAEFQLNWLGHEGDFGLGAVYEDFLSADEPGRGRVYTVLCGDDLNSIHPGRVLPELLNREVKAHWKAVGPPH